MDSPHPLGAGAATIGVLAAAAVVWGLPALFSKTPPWHVWRGADGKPSTSKFQFFLWTTTVVFAYVAIFVQRCLDRDEFAAVAEIPSNLLLAMGFSGGTLAASKAITTQFIASGRIAKVSDGVGNVFTDDDGQTDLSKAQLMGWTFIGIGVYVVSTFRADVTKGLPDIDGALMVLMGLGHGTYLGKKLVTTDTPQLLSIGQLVRPGADVVVTASGLGTTPGTVMLDGFALVGVRLAWEDAKVTFALPPTHPNASAWLDGQRVILSIDVGGRTAASDLPFVVGLVPRIASLSTASATPGSAVALSGQLLGGARVTVSVGGVAAAVVTSNDTTIQFTVPNMPATPRAPVQVTVDGFPSAAFPLDVTA